MTAINEFIIWPITPAISVHKSPTTLRSLTEKLDIFIKYFSFFALISLAIKIPQKNTIQPIFFF